MDSGPAHILHVDPDQVWHEILSRHFAEAGLQLVPAANGREALAALQRAAPRLVLLELSLPDMHGLELVRRLRVRHSALPPILALTSQTHRDEVQACLEAMLSGYLVKAEVPIPHIVATAARLRIAS